MSLKKADNVFSGLAKELGMEQALKDLRVFERWPRLINPPLSTHIRPLHMKKGELLLGADSPAWLKQADLMKADIIRRLAHLGVRSIRLKLGFGSGKQDKNPAHKYEPPLLGPPDTDAVEDIISGIGDTELKASVKRAAIKWSQRTSRKQ